MYDYICIRVGSGNSHLNISTVWIPCPIWTLDPRAQPLNQAPASPDNFAISKRLFHLDQCWATWINGSKCLEPISEIDIYTTSIQCSLIRIVYNMRYIIYNILLYAINRHII